MIDSIFSEQIEGWKAVFYLTLTLYRLKRSYFALTRCSHNDDLLAQFEGPQLQEATDGVGRRLGFNNEIPLKTTSLDLLLTV